ncbi:MAG: hypothetical protein IKZ55_02775 [Bacteroidales bacterium]|nr:hypothetical protein [Bacteroidales bacterium]
MKKLALTIAIVFGLVLGLNAQKSGLFSRGYVFDEEYYGAGDRTLGAGTPFLPNHSNPNNFDADSPVGSGIVLLTALGAAYLVGKRRKED